jgi:hypothetical protein
MTLIDCKCWGWDFFHIIGSRSRILPVYPDSMFANTNRLLGGRHFATRAY